MNINLPELPFDSETFNLKNSIIAIAVLYTIGLSIFLIHSTLKVASPLVNYSSPSSVNRTETGITTSCDTDADCWCRSFDGTKFLPGTTNSSCNKETHMCVACLYR